MKARTGRAALSAAERVEARYEFRSFGQQFHAIRRRLGALTAPLPDAVRERRSEETYLVSRASDVSNVKVRDGMLDIKTWVHSDDGLEQWSPLVKAPFPIDGALLRAELFPALGVPPPALLDGSVDADRLIDVVRAQPGLAVARLRKRRFAYLVHGTICEYAVVLVNGARVVTVSAESTDLGALRRTLEETGMAGLENINYVQAIKRIIGMSDKALAN